MLLWRFNAAGNNETHNFIQRAKYFWPISTICIFFMEFPQKTPIKKFRETPSSGRRADKCIQTDWQDKGNRLILQLCSDPKTAFCSKYIYIFCTILTVKISYWIKQHEPTHLCNEEAVYYLWCRNWRLWNILHTMKGHALSTAWILFHFITLSEPDYCGR